MTEPVVNLYAGVPKGSYDVLFDTAAMSMHVYLKKSRENSFGNPDKMQKITL